MTIREVSYTHGRRFDFILRDVSNVFFTGILVKIRALEHEEKHLWRRCDGYPTETRINC